jgi:hypothetical protein
MKRGTSHTAVDSAEGGLAPIDRWRGYLSVCNLAAALAEFAEHLT